MSHTTNCETATTNTCVCPCGGARHGAVLIRGISSTSPAAQDEAYRWAEPGAWTRLPAATQTTTVDSNADDRRPAMTGVICELVLALIDDARVSGQLDVIETLAREISDDIGDEFERSLDDGGPGHRSNRHLWCVVLATLCRAYDQSFGFARRSVESIVDEVMSLIRDGVSSERGEETKARDVYWYRHRIVSAFEPDEYDFLGTLVKRAVESIIAAMQEAGEDAVMRHLRLIGAIACPDPDHHPDVVKYCIWPLLSGPFRELLDEAIEDQMRTWLRNAYVSVPWE